LTAGNWDIQTAAALFYDGDAPGNEASPPDADMADDEPQDASSPPQQQHPGGGRTLSGAYVPAAASSSSSAQPAARQPPQRGARGMRTLGDLQSGGGGGHSHDDESDDDEKTDLFTGGEKSGLAVQNPNQSNPRDQIENILRRARQWVGHPKYRTTQTNTAQERPPAWR